MQGAVHAMSMIYDLIKQEPEVGQFHALTQPTYRVPKPPRFFFGRFPTGIAAQYFTNYRGLGPAGTFLIRNVQFHADYLMTHDSHAIICSELNIHPAHITQALLSIAGEQRPIRKIDGRAAYILGPGHSIFGHWLVDHLPKLQVLANSGYDISSLIYLLPKSTPSWGLELLGIIGLKPEQFVFFDPDVEIVEIEEVILPTFLHNGIRFSPIFTAAISSIRQAALAGLEYPSPPHQGARIYISRAKTSQSRPFLNRISSEAIAQEYGFQVCHPEQLSIRDQIRLFASAGSIVGEYGSAHHMSIFSAPGTVVCGIRGSAFHPGFIQNGIGGALSQPTGYIFGQTNEWDDRGEFSIEEQSLRDCLEAVFRGHPFE
jgi:hypothetical protein